MSRDIYRKEQLRGGFARLARQNRIIVGVCRYFRVYYLINPLGDDQVFDRRAEIIRSFRVRARREFHPMNPTETLSHRVMLLYPLWGSLRHRAKTKGFTSCLSVCLCRNETGRDGEYFGRNISNGLRHRAMITPR